MSTSRIVLALVVALLFGCAAPLFAQTVPPATQEQEQELIAVLESDAPQKEKADACRGLGLIGSKDAVPALAALLGDEKLSHMARYGLEPIPDPSVDDALREALGKLKGLPLVGVIGSIGVRGDAEAVAPLIEMLRGSDQEVATAAARSLGRIATPEAAGALEAMLAEAPRPLRLVVADGCLACAEALLAQGKRNEAAAMYGKVGQADLPKHFRIAAAYGALQARRPAGKP